MFVGNHWYVWEVRSVSTDPYGGFVSVPLKEIVEKQYNNLM